MKAAEELFAHGGFHHTTMRAITSKAGVNLSAVNYHFGSKEALLTAIFDMHWTPINEERVQRLSRVAKKSQEEPQPPTIEEAMRSFIEPTFALFQSGASGGYFRIIVGRALSEPDQTVREIFLHRVMPVIEMLKDLLCQAMPRTSRAEVSWKLRFALGAMSQTLTGHNQPPLFYLGEEKVSSGVVDLLIGFIVKGMQE
ncbi:MAG: TetR/AcrR family transcriptional regulator [Desulfobulbaceae bacterium]|nr:TetR/AcrR family transcriptional regulator [Desulfobulbaceae bacterium]